MDTSSFLSALYAGIPHGFVEMRLIQNNGYIKRMYRPLPIGEINTSGLSRLRELNTTYHIYHRMGVSMTQRSRKTDIAMLPALWLDVDDCSQAAFDKLLAMDFYPNIITHSGGGFHAYWLLQQPVTCDSEKAWFEIERTMEGMILSCGIADVDAVAKDITRILRTPGFCNIKDKYPDKPLCKVVFYDEARYTFNLLHSAYAPLGAPKQPQITRHIPTEALTKQVPNRVKDYLSSPVGRGSRNNELYYCARAYLDAGYSQMEAINDLAPCGRRDGLRDDEISGTIASAYRNAPNPSVALPQHMRSFMAVEDNV